MKLTTTRFGAVQIEDHDILHFARGLAGFEECRSWVLLADAHNEAVAWLQCISRVDVAIPVTSPRRFVPDYKVRIPRSQLTALQLRDIDQTFVLAVIGKTDRCLTLNLRAPLIINLDQRLGAQVVTADEQPLQFEVAPLPLKLRRSA